MRTHWLIVVLADSPEDAYERAVETIESWDHNGIYDYYNMCNDVPPICAAEPEFFEKLNNHIKDYDERMNAKKVSIKNRLDEIFPNGFTSQELVDLLGKIHYPEEFNLRHDLRHLIDYSNNYMTPVSGIMWDVQYADQPYPDESMINDIKDDPDGWYIVEAIFHW